MPDATGVYDEMIEQVAQENAKKIADTKTIFNRPLGTIKVPDKLLKEEWQVRTPEYVQEMYEKAITDPDVRGGPVGAWLEILKHDKEMRDGTT